MLGLRTVTSVKRFAAEDRRVSKLRRFAFFQILVLGEKPIFAGVPVILGKQEQDISMRNISNSCQFLLQTLYFNYYITFMYYTS